jgi:hypothetical protein
MNIGETRRSAGLGLARPAELVDPRQIRIDRIGEDGEPRA